MANILTYIELLDGVATTESLHTLNRAREVATYLGATLYALLPCAMTPSYSDEDIISILARHGADKVILITHPRLRTPAYFATHGEAVKEACMQLPPRLLLFPASALGEDLAPRIAVLLGAHYAPDSRLEVGADGIQITRTVFRRGYRSREPLTRFSSPTVLTLQARDGAPGLLGDEEAEVVVVHAPVDASPQLEVEGRDVLPRETLASSRVVIGGGGGLPDGAAFQLLCELAKRLDAVPAASATACARGIAPPALRVGLDGGLVEADYYVAFGISGSPRHLAALAPRTQILAINSDPDAPIFRVARYNLIADAVETIKTLLEQTAQTAPAGGAR